jgi:hypothetical protein
MGLDMHTRRALTNGASPPEPGGLRCYTQLIEPPCTNRTHGDVTFYKFFLDGEKII